MSLVLLIVFGMPLVIFVGQAIGAIIGFVVTLAFHALRGCFRYFVLAGVRRMFAKKELNESTR